MYLIKKTIIKNGKKNHVLLNNEYSEILEIHHKNIADKLCAVMNENSENNHFYDVIPVKEDK